MTVRQILLQAVPESIVQQIHSSIADDIGTVTHDNYNWQPANDAVQTWCKQHVSPDMYWGIQVITGNLKMHKDIGTCIKFNYIIDTAGTGVVTNFYNDNHELLESVILKSHTWYLMDVAVYHSVELVEPGQTRISLTGRVFPITRT